MSLTTSVLATIAQAADPASAADGDPQTYSDFVRQYLTVGIFMALGLGLAAGLLGLGKLLRPDRPQPEKYLTYESGVDPVGTGWSQSQVRYYIFALLFVLFDVEAVFIFPWATRLNDSVVQNADGTTTLVEGYGLFGLVEMTIFIVILALGLLYAWRKKVLRWL